MSTDACSEALLGCTKAIRCQWAESLHPIYCRHGSEYQHEYQVASPALTESIEFDASIS